MDIHQRINARKLMLSYVYHYCFLAKLASSVERATQEKAEFPTSEQRDPFFDQYFLADLKMLWEQEAKAGERTQQKIASLLSEANEEEIPYYLKYFFDQWQESDVDMEYCVKIGSVFSSYVSEMERAVDTYTESFNYQQMDAIDQAIFLLWYTEWKVLGTPKEILINEMVELAKRYSDSGAPKLVNGIMDKVIK